MHEPLTDHDIDIDALARLHDDAHARLEALFHQGLEALTALDLPGAEARWAALSRAIVVHAEAEESCFAGALDDAFEPPRGASARIFVPEHRTLERLLRDGAATLAGLSTDVADAPLRGRMVRALEPLLRVHHLLSHHHTRERDIIYPWVLPRLDAGARRRLRAGLVASLGAR